MLACVHGKSCKIAGIMSRIFQLWDVEHAIPLWAHKKRVVVALPSVIARAVVNTVSEGPRASCHVKIEGQARERIVGYGVAGGNGGEDAARTVGEERCHVGCEEVFVHVSHAHKQVCVPPCVHVAEHGNGSKHVVGLNVWEALPVGKNSLFFCLCHM